MAALTASLALAGTAVAGAVPAVAADPPTPDPTAPGAGIPATGLPTAPTDTPALVEGLADEVDATVPAATAARAHLRDHRSRYAIADPDDDLATGPVTTDPDGTTTVRLDQRYGGLPVFGAQYVVRMTDHAGKRTVTGTSGTYFSELSVSTTQKTLPAAAAVRHAVDAVRASLQGSSTRFLASAPGHGSARVQQDALSGTDAGLAVLPSGAGVLVRHVTVRGSDTASGTPVLQQVYVDALTGAPLLQYSGIQTFAAPGQTPAQGKQGRSYEPAQPSGPGALSAPGDVVGSGTKLDGDTASLHLTKAADGSYALEDHATQAPDQGGAIATWNASGLWVEDVSGVWPEGITEFTSPTPALGADLTDVGAVDAHWDAAEVYAFYRDHLHRKSLDGKGMAINSLIGVTDYGNPFVNAFWDSEGHKMVYGSGNDEYMPLSADLDVVGHEMTHGVVQNTANLLYLGQSGALNEAVADYFGNAIDVTVSGTPMSDPDASLIGGDLCRTLSPTKCALRDLDDARTTASFLSMPADQPHDEGGVHLNSTIFSGALWDIREQLGGTLADDLVYRALSSYWTPMSDFTGAADGVVAAAKDLGLTGTQLGVVKKAFAAHGIVDGWEKKVLGTDAQVLLPGVSSTQEGVGYGITPSVADGRWAVTRSDDSETAPYAIWTGQVDGKGEPVRVSPDNGLEAVSPVTDGKRVAWVEVTPYTFDDDDNYVPATYRILSAPVTGGRPKVVWTTDGEISGLSIDGDVVAWSEPGAQYTPRVRYLVGNQTVPTTIEPDGWTGETEGPIVKDGHIAYVHYQWSEDSWSMGVDVLDLKTGKTAHGWQAPEAEWMSAPTVNSEGAYWVVDADYGNEENTVAYVSFDGTTTGPVIPEGTGHGVRAEMVTASDTTLTVMEDPTQADLYGPIGEAMLPKIRQFTLTGSPLGRVSCAPGAQLLPAADTGRMVVWVDSRTSSNALVAASKPKGSCA